MPRRILLLVGDNAQGKTSILEAIYYLAVFKSINAQSDRQLINFLSHRESLAVARLVAEYKRSEIHHKLEVRLIQEPGNNGGKRMRKEILLDGNRRTVHKALGHFNAVIFLPQMTRILEGGPEERRRYLNLALSQAVSGYAQALSKYSQVMSRRNALLRQLADRSGDEKQLIYWDDLLTLSGSLLIHARIAAIKELGELAANIHYHLTNSIGVLRLVYQPAYNPLTQPDGQISLPMQSSEDRTGISREKIQQGFKEHLLALRREEIIRGVTTIGPHRDDMRIINNGIDLGDFGSRGQIRTALLAIKLAETDWLKEKTGHWPVLLLDEVLAELDVQRRLDLLEYVRKYEQAILTTTDPNLFSPQFVAESAVWNVNEGRINIT